MKSGRRITAGVICFLAVVAAAQGQVGLGGITARAFGDRHWRAPVATEAQLPPTGNLVGDRICTNDDGHEYWWDGNAWQEVAAGAGEPGPQGEKGDKGDPGDVGPPGATGPAPSGAANLFLATPNGTAGISSLRAIAPADLSAIPYAAAGAQGGAATSVAPGAIIDLSVAVAAGIQESKLALSFPTHSNANDPTVGQKAALAGTTGTPSALNPFTTSTDPRLSDSRTPLSHGHVGADVAGTATRCARFDASGQLAAASGDCSAGDTTGSPSGSGTELQARSGSSFAAVTGSSVTGANVTLTGTLNIGGGAGFARLYSPGFDILSLYNGDASDYAIVNGQRFRAWTGGNVAANLQGNVGVELASTNSVAWASGADATQAKDVSIGRSSSAVVKIGDALRLYPRSSPPVICGNAGTAGVVYFDADSASFCGCNGSAWSAGFGTAGPCS